MVDVYRNTINSWSFVGAKQKNSAPEMGPAIPNAGDAWTWVAMDADTMLICTWMVGNRDHNRRSPFWRFLVSSKNKPNASHRQMESSNFSLVEFHSSVYIVSAHSKMPC